MEHDGDHRGHRTHAGLFLVAIVRVCVCVIFYLLSSVEKVSLLFYASVCASKVFLMDRIEKGREKKKKGKNWPVVERHPAIFLLFLFFISLTTDGENRI